MTQSKPLLTGSLYVDTFRGLIGLLPLLIYGLLMYALFIAVPRWFRTKLKGNRKDKAAPSPVNTDNAHEPGPRRRTRVPISSVDRVERSVLPARRPTVPLSASAVHSLNSTTEFGAISEAVSVVLRRQIPPRLDEPVRSWLGGLPSMPNEIEWPRSVSSEHPDRGERPLHFLAQICCADFPKELWGSLGPREGYLLLFIDPNQGCPESDDAFRIIHIPQLGPERAAPFDLGPVHDGVYTGPDYRYLLPGEQIPNSWRRWPVDIVVVPNAARQEEGRVLVAPDNFAAQLYPDQQITPERGRTAPVRPLTYGQALYALHALRADLKRAIPPIQLSPVFCSELRKEGVVGALRDHHERQAHKAREDRQTLIEQAQRRGGSEKHNEQLQWNSSRIAHAERQHNWLAEMGDAEAIIRYLEASPALEEAWQDGLRQLVDAAIETVRERDPDSLLSEQDWSELMATFAGRDFIRWQNERIRETTDQPAIRFREHRRSSQLAPPVAMREILADMYVDPVRRAWIPDDALSAYEPHWRQLYNNRPHRMGGYHDGLQSDAVIGPTENLLLFQIASDNAMHWCWGDGGAYYFWIKPKHLAASDFSGVEMGLECH